MENQGKVVDINIMRDTIKRLDLLNLKTVLESFGNQKAPFKFSYAIAKNINIIKQESNALEAALKPDDKYLEFDQKRIELCQKRARKEEDGRPMIVPGPMGGQGQFVLENVEAFNEELGKLREEYKEALENQENKIKEYQKMLEEPITVKFHKIAKEDFPQEIKPNDLAAMLILMIE